MNPPKSIATDHAARLVDVHAGMYESSIIGEWAGSDRYADTSFTVFENRDFFDASAPNPLPAAMAPPPNAKEMGQHNENY